LVETINEGIAIRGIYLLMDERLDQICGPNTLQKIDSPEVTQKNRAIFDCSRLVGYRIPNWIRLFWLIVRLFDLPECRLAGAQAEIFSGVVRGD